MAASLLLRVPFYVAANEAPEAEPTSTTTMKAAATQPRAAVIGVTNLRRTLIQSGPPRSPGERIPPGLVARSGPVRSFGGRGERRDDHAVAGEQQIRITRVGQGWSIQLHHLPPEAAQLGFGRRPSPRLGQACCRDGPQAVAGPHRPGPAGGDPGAGVRGRGGSWNGSPHGRGAPEWGCGSGCAPRLRGGGRPGRCWNRSYPDGRDAWPTGGEVVEAEAAVVEGGGRGW